MSHSPDGVGSDIFLVTAKRKCPALAQVNGTIAKKFYQTKKWNCSKAAYHATRVNPSMKSPLVYSRRSLLERVSLTLAGLLVGIGSVTLLGWMFSIDELTLPIAGYAPMKANCALTFVLLGVILIAVDLGNPRAALAAVFPALISTMSLGQGVFGRELQVDQLLADAHLRLFTEHPGRMAVVIASCLALASLITAWRATRRGRRFRRVAEAISGSFIASVGLSTLVGYRTGLEIVTTWGSATPTPPVAAFALVILGSALVILAWRESVQDKNDAPAWAPIPAVIGCLTLSAVFFLGLRAREQAASTAATAVTADTFAVVTREALAHQRSEFERMARRWGDSPFGLTESFQEWQTDTIRQLRESGLTDLGCISTAFVDLSYRSVWQWPAALGPLLDHRTVEVRRLALEQSQRTGAPAISSITPIGANPAQTERGAVIYTPVVRSGRTAGFLAAEFSYPTLFQHLTQRRLRLTSNYHVAVAVDGHPVFAMGAAPDSRTRPLMVEKTHLVSGHRIRVSLTPTAAYLDAERNFLPELALWAGFGFTVLLGLSVHLAGRARTGQRAAELSHARLYAENEERRQIEERLKVSDERLRLALDSTQIGIFEWNVAAGHIYFSPGLWAMLGYDYGRMPDTVEAWQSMIHPDDLARYRAGVDSQLNGVASFIDPEYRVRARDGQWRWVYTRAKSVPTRPDGRPTLIVGTVQDITARREAEHALRASQSEARKLSLVAAKTDNPVLIGSPDGCIEWVNEAFSRVMEYSLDEAVGRNPAHLLVGPGTDRRTVRRIRAAISRGQGISTDVVNYSKSGRKYHLHVEIQPVHGVDGRLENFIAVQTDITARVETELQLRRAKAEADAASRSKSEFLASMSHEIRTPMNGVIGMTSLILETPLTGDQRDCVNTIRTSGEALLLIINDILDFSKIESGKMDLEQAPFDLSMCIEEALDLFALQASSKRLEIGYHIAPDVPSWIVGDVTRVRQVMVNLLNNGIKFTPSGSISIEARILPATKPFLSKGNEPRNPESVMLEFTVRDTGIGIPPDRLHRLFQAFSQVDSSTTRKYGGTGLGLAISRQLCELMGGSIRAESTGAGGSTFIFTIRTRPAPDQFETAPFTPVVLRTGWVLCVEDHPVTQGRLRTLFAQLGVDCQIASDAREAVIAAKRADRPPALLVVDAGEYESRPPFDALAGIAGPRLVLFPFGQNAPLPPSLDWPYASTAKPIRTGAFIQAMHSIFQSPVQESGGTSSPFERPLADEFPLEVLLAEDNRVNQKVALRFLERLGYRAEAVANGLEAVTAVENRRYDLVLMDVQMPEMDGYEATRQIRARLTPERQPKIFALTANALQVDRDLAVAAGMDDHISKPVKMHEISAAIRRHFTPAAVGDRERP